MFVCPAPLLVCDVLRWVRLCDVICSDESGFCDAMCSDESSCCDVMCSDESGFCDVLCVGVFLAKPSQIVF